MTDKLHCPFCGATLKEGYNDIVMSCFDTEPCPCYDGFKRQVYQALIDGKKAQDALKVVTDCIENIGNTWRGDQRWANDDMDEIRINIEKYCDGTLQKIKELKK